MASVRGETAGGAATLTPTANIEEEINLTNLTGIALHNSNFVLA